MKIEDFKPLLNTVKRRKLQWFGQVTRRTGTLAHEVMHGGVDGQRTRSPMEKLAGGRQNMDKETGDGLRTDGEGQGLMEKDIQVPQRPTGYGCDLT